MLAIAGTIFDIAKKIYYQANLTQENKARFQSLTSRIQFIEQSVKSLVNSGNTQQYQGALKNLECCLNEINSFITSVSEQSRLGRFVWAQQHDARLAEFVSQLEIAKSDLSFGLAAKHDGDVGSIRTNVKEMVLFLRSNPSANAAQIGLIIPARELQYKESTPSKQSPDFIGSGNFGTVYKGLWTRSRPYKPVAIKKLHDTLTVQTSREAGVDAFQKEVKIMQNLVDDHIVQLYGICLDTSTYCMVMEFMPRGSLDKLLHSNEPFLWRTRYQIGIDVANGLHFLHGSNMVHRDIKSMNVLLDNGLGAKLTDFGLSKMLGETGGAGYMGNQTVGTLGWMAPELMPERGHPCYSNRSDMYAYGVLLWEIVTRKEPYQTGETQATIISRIRRKDRDPIPSTCLPQLTQLIKQCWDLIEGKDRPTAEQAAVVIEGLLGAHKETTTFSRSNSNLRTHTPLSQSQSSTTSISSSHNQESVSSTTQAAGVLGSLQDINHISCIRTLQRHTSYVSSVAFSPTGDVLASGSHDDTVRLWEVSSGRLLKTLSGHTVCVRSVAFSGTGDVLASGSKDKTVRLWGNVDTLIRFANQGDANAQFLFALCYKNGKGIPKDKRRAKELLRQAAAQGHPEAQQTLKSCIIM